MSPVPPPVLDQPRWLDFAWADLGVAEDTGATSNPRVVAYYADAGVPAVSDDSTAWCAAFVGACLQRAGVPGTRSLMARSYLDWGTPLDVPAYGAIAVLSRTADPALGHVGFLLAATASQVVLLGGNQSNRVSVEAFDRGRLLGLRWPAAAPPPAASGTAPLDAVFERSLAHVLEMEGGFTDDPYDPGGPTNRGITLAVYAREKGATLTADTMALLVEELKRIPEATVRRIYLERYWLPAACPQLPAPLALFHFDAAVNQGVAGAARMLQQAVGVAMDGEIGPVTLAAVARQPIALTLAVYAEIRRQRYRALEHFWRFGKGWLNRVDRTLALASSLAGDMPALPVSPQPQPQESRPMTNQSPTPDLPQSESKWWGSSLTIWGVIMTTLSSVLPTIGPALGINITAELIQQLGQNVVLFGQAGGALIGTLMTIYGRVRAVAPLERRDVTMKL